MCRWPMVVVPVRAEQRTTLAPACKRPQRRMWQHHPRDLEKLHTPNKNQSKIHQKHTSPTEKKHQKSIMFQYFKIFSTFLRVFYIFPGIPRVFPTFPHPFPNISPARPRPTAWPRRGSAGRCAPTPPPHWSARGVSSWAAWWSASEVVWWFIYMIYIYIYISGWWFGTWILFLHILGITIPTG